MSRPRRGRSRRDVDLVQAAREVIARRSRRIFFAFGDCARSGRAALEKLAERGVDLTDIALDLGFSNPSHFTESFRRNFGKTPSAVRDCW